MASPTISRLKLSVLRVTEKTWWSFIEVTDSDGRTGVGESTLTGREDRLVDTARTLFPRFHSQPVDCDTGSAILRTASDLPTAAILSGIDHALWDLRAKRAASPMAACLGTVLHAGVAVYANINRRTAARTPESFAASARSALAAGFSAVKIAPFDEVTFYGKDADATTMRRAIARGVERIAATREAVGASSELMVDCHWRLNEATAMLVLDELAALNLYWLECPLPETFDHLDALKRLRSRANAKGVRLAGCEEAIACRGFRRFLEVGAYDVMMPDVKYVGGVREMIDVAATLERHGVEFSPHNPSGPVAHAVSLQISAVVPNFRRLEMQFDETSLFDALQAAPLSAADRGVVRLTAAPGHGAALNPPVAARYTQSEVETGGATSG
jgi:galactonate dehydratase